MFGVSGVIGEDGVRGAVKPRDENENGFIIKFELIPLLLLLLLLLTLTLLRVPYCKFSPLFNELYPELTGADVC